MENKINIFDKINLNNGFLINLQLFKDDYTLNWPNLNDLTEMMPSTADLSLKEDINVFKNNLIIFEDTNNSSNKVLDIFGKENDFSLKNKINDLNFDLNIYDAKNMDREENEDCSSKMTNLYIQEFEEKKINNKYFE